MTSRVVPSAMPRITATIDASTPKTPPESHSGPQRSGEQAARRLPRDGDAEDAALGEVPAGMDADRQPEAARQQVGGGEHHAGLEHDRHRALQRRVRIDEVEQAEDRRRQDQRDPGAKRTLDDAKDDAAKDDLLDEPRADRGHEGNRHDREVVLAVDVVVAEQRQRADGNGEQCRAENEAAADLLAGPRQRQLGHRPALDPAHIGDVGGHAQATGHERGQQRAEQGAVGAGEMGNRQGEDEYRHDEPQGDGETYACRLETRSIHGHDSVAVPSPVRRGL